MRQVNYSTAAIGYLLTAVLLGSLKPKNEVVFYIIGQACVFLVLLGIIYLFNLWLRKRHEKTMANIQKKNEEAIGWKGWGK